MALELTAKCWETSIVKTLPIITNYEAEYIRKHIKKYQSKTTERTSEKRTKKKNTPQKTKETKPLSHTPPTAMVSWLVRQATLAQAGRMPPPSPILQHLKETEAAGGSGWEWDVFVWGGEEKKC